MSQHTTARFSQMPPQAGTADASTRAAVRHRDGARTQMSEEGRQLLKNLKAPPSDRQKYLRLFQLEHRPHLAAPESTYDCCTRGLMQDHPVIDHHRL